MANLTEHLVPRPMSFQLHKECGEPGIFSHMCGVNSRMAVEKT